MTACPPGTRVTAYAFSAARGLPCDLAALADLGLAAARHARWLGIPEFRVPEGPYIVHTWPAEIYEYVTAWQAQADAEAQCGQPPSASYQPWREGGRALPAGDGITREEARILAGAYGPDEVIPPWCPLPAEPGHGYWETGDYGRCEVTADEYGGLPWDGDDIRP
jgi:hypothetical protein